MITLDFLPQLAFVFMALFARLGAITMTLPGIGEKAVPRRIRLVFALAVAFVMLPVAQPLFGPMPDKLNALFGLLASEVAVGLFIGFTVRLIMASLSIAGTVISFQTGLSFAQSFDPVQGVQGAILGAFLSVLAVTLIFAADLHHLLLAAMHDSYQLFKPGAPLPVGDFGKYALDTVAGAFRIAIQMAAPFIVFGLVFYMGLGILSRLMPQVQIFFVAMPANIAIGFLLMALLVSALMMWFLDYFTSAIQPFLVQ